MSTVTQQLEPEVLKSRIERFRQVQSEIVTQVRRVIVGQEEVLEQVMIALFVGGHCLITGLPGTAKTLLVRTMAQTLGLVFKRIQFTPDLMPTDITGTDIIEEDPTTGRRTWTFVQGPIFGNVLLADEINRTPPKTQSALLEAMQERSCTVRGNNYTLPDAVLRAGHAEPDRTGRHVSAARSAARPLPVQHRAGLPDCRRGNEGGRPDHVTTHRAGRPGDQREGDPGVPATGAHGADRRERRALRSGPGARHPRQSTTTAPDFVKKYVNYGASVRAAQFLVLAAKARALMKGRYHVTYEDIRALYIAGAAAPHPAELPRGDRID